MTEQTTGKVAQLTPEEWKHLGVLNVVQLQNFLQSIPSNGETGVSGLTAGHMALVDDHIERLRTFLNAWARAKLDLSLKTEAKPKAEASNGAVKKGGWPKGKKRTRKPATPATAEQ